MPKKIALRFEYDENIIDVIERIDVALEEFGLTLQFDGKEHDGFEICELRELTDEEKL